jgi:hypothetical protein
VKLTALQGETILSGIEIIREGLKIGDVQEGAELSTQQH